VSPLAHAAVALGLFAAIAPFFGPAAGAVAGIALYLGREGAEAQWSTRRPKAETVWLPVSPWAWPRQMQLDAAAPAAASLAAWALWWAVRS
jgi:hypothetical protein